MKSLLRGSETARALFALGFAVICGGAAFVLWAGAGRPNPIKLLEADNVTAWLTAISSDDRPATPVTFIDVDEASYESWKNPKSIPREHLIGLLEIVDKGRPAAIVLDFDITQDDAGETAALADYLVRRSSVVPLLLVRPFTRLPTRNDAAGAVLERPSQIDLRQLPTSGTRWVAAFLDTDDGWFSRRWRGYEVVCSDGAPRAYPAVALATAALARDPVAGLGQLDQWLKQAALRRCAPGQDIHDAAGTPSWLRNASGALLIPYSVGFTKELLRFGSTTAGGRALPIFARLSAGHLIERKQDYLAEPPDLSDRVAIIGASYEASGDWHRTPLGRMPGMYVIGNMVAFAGAILDENRWWGLKPLLLGIAFFALHAAASLIFRGAVALAIVAATTAVALPLLVRAGASATTAYEGVVIGLAIIGLHASAKAAIDAFAAHSPDAGTHWFGRLLLSERSRKWLSSRRPRKA